MGIGLRSGTGEIFFVIPVCNHCNGRFCLGLELFLNQRCAGKDGGTLIQHGLLLGTKFPPGGCGHGEIPKVIHPAPGITEIRNPGNARFLMEFLADKMHGMRRSCGHNGVYRVLLKVLQQRFHAWLYPANAGVRNKQIGPYPQAQALLEGLFAAGDFCYLSAFGAGEFAIRGVGFPDFSADNLNAFRNFHPKAWVKRGIIGILRSKHHRLPTL